MVIVKCGYSVEIAGLFQPCTDTIDDKLAARRYSMLPAAQGTMMVMVEVTGYLVTRVERRMSGEPFGCMPMPGTRSSSKVTVKLLDCMSGQNGEHKIKSVKALQQ